MKGIAHFITGVALATFFPDVVAAARGGSLLPVLGGVGGILPDLLDFRFVRYWMAFDVEIDPGLETRHARAEAMADQLVGAMTDAYDSRTPRRTILHTVRMGADLWRRYSVRIDPMEGEVAVRMGPLVDTGQYRVAGSEPPDAGWAVRKLPFAISHAYQRHYDVDIFTGPSFRFTRQGNRLAIHFLDWHHRWTHSLPLALAAGLCLGLLCWALFGLRVGALCGCVLALGFAAHALEDQLGHMGCNLLWPFTRARTPGLGLLHSADPWPNILTVWTALAVILLNLDRQGGPGLLPVVPYLGVVVVAPWILAATIQSVQGARRAPRPSPGFDAVPMPSERQSYAEAERLVEVLDRDSA